MVRALIGPLAPHGQRFVAFFGLWLLLTTTLDAQELVAGVAAAGVAAFTAAMVHRQGITGFRPKLAWVLRARRVPIRVVRDSIVVFRALLLQLAGRRQVAGVFRALRWDTGSDDAHALTRRALVTAAISITPNTYVVGIDRHENLVLVHQLVASDRAHTRDDVMGWL
jgi:multisubunit Na+/H+ antiporter MnhE subunit